jgi:putative ABC transport system permease protein
MPLLAERQLNGERTGPLLKRGEMLIPVIVANGLQVKPGDTVVLVATNRDGSVNGKTFVVRGSLESATGPGGRDGYIHIDDARELLRITEPEVTEFTVRAKSLERAQHIQDGLNAELSAIRNQKGLPALEVHPWQRLTPFSNIANMIDVLTLAIKVMLVSIVLVAVMNVMVMAVYERIREIGTISAIGTPPRRILALFVTEGLLLGVAGSLIGSAASLVAIYALNVWKISYDFGQQQGLLLAPSISMQDVASIAAMVIVVAVIASLQPAWKAARMDPITALRHV